MKKLFFGIIFGVDMISAMLIFLILSISFGTGWDLGNLRLAILFTHLPDLDMIPYLIVRKYLPRPSHWIVGHHPILIVIGAVCITWWITSSELLVMMAFLGTVAHFLHDATNPAGLHILSPFSWKRFRLVKGRFKFIPPQIAEERFNERCWRWNGDLVKQMTGRAESISPNQLMVWFIVFILVITYLESSWFH